MSFKLFGRMYRVRKGSPMHYFLEIGVPALLMIGTCFLVILWSAVLGQLAELEGVSMRTYIVGIHNGYDVDDYYINAESADEACDIALSMAGYGYVYCVV